MTRSSSSGWTLAFGLIGAAFALACGLAFAGTAHPPRAVAAERHNPPNIVLIQADDQTLGQLTGKVMPKTKRDLIRPGTEFTNYMVTTAECCPSRASLITGEYAHNDGVTSNQVGYPGLKAKRNVLPVWLRRSGYRTMHVGAKYLNGYREFAGKKVAPGWSNWFTVLSHTQYYKYVASEDGHRRNFGKRPGDYITRVLGRKATGLINQYAKQRRPFFLQLDERAPHVSRTKDPYGDCDEKPIPDRRDERRFSHAGLPEPPSYNEADMSDKPPFLQAAPRVGPRNEARLTAKWRCSLDSLVGVDRNVGKVFKAVKKSGELNNTVFIYISDNGLFYGEHRIVEGKVFPYEEAINMPLVVRIPKRYRQGARRIDRTGKLVGNIDLAPTILDLAHAKPCAHGRCRTMDGRSLMPLLTGHGKWPPGRALLNEYSVPDVPRYSTCEFAGIRTRTDIYVEHYRVVNPATHKCQATLQKERYSLKKDPFELNSLCHGGGPNSCPNNKNQLHLEAQLQRLRHCAGIKGRDRRSGTRPFCK
ncbi:MAG: sulfatase [Actinobacteria bacterium]|nr:MAG: sulfatase [Actinomycetota bacterium]